MERTNETSGANEARTDWNLLLRLFDYKAEHTRKLDGEQKPETHDYTRARMLWRVFHRETLNGAATTDIFPGMTFDRHADGQRSWSLLWRFLAYRHDDDDGSRKLHLLFIPIPLE